VEYTYVVQADKLIKKAGELKSREFEVKAKTLSGAWHKAQKQLGSEERITECFPLLRTENQKETYARRIIKRAKTIVASQETYAMRSALKAAIAERRKDVV